MRLLVGRASAPRAPRRAADEAMLTALAGQLATERLSDLQEQFFEAPPHPFPWVRPGGLLKAFSVGGR